MANEVLFDVDEVKKGMDALETDFNNFAETLKGINDYMETMINAGADSAIFGDYGSKLYQIWSANASTFGDFHANFEAWSEVVAVISAEKADFVVDTAALYRDNGSTLDGVQGAREHVRENGRLGEYTGDDEAIKAVLANASQTEAGSGGTSSTTGVNEFGGVNEEDASGYTLIKDANGNVIAQYKDGVYYDELGHPIGDFEAYKEWLKDKKGFTDEQLENLTEVGKGQQQTQQTENEFGGVNEEDASGYTLIKDASGNVIAQYKDGMYYDELGHPIGDFEAYKEWLKDKKGFTDEQLENVTEVGSGSQSQGSQTTTTKYTDYDGQEHDALSATSETDSNGNTTTTYDLGVDGKVVIKTDKDGNIVKQQTYDADGNLVNEVSVGTTGSGDARVHRIEYENGQKRSETVTDENGKLVEEVTYHSTGKTETRKYYGDDGETVTKEVHFDEDGHRTRQIEYDNSGNRTKETEYSNGQASKETEYNANGDVTKETVYTSEGRTETTYDGNVTEIRNYDNDGNYTGGQHQENGNNYDMNEDGTPVIEATTGSDEHGSYSETITEIGNGTVTTREYEDGTKTEITEYDSGTGHVKTYDEQGRVVSNVSHDADGYETVRNYYYDADGNQYKSVTTPDGTTKYYGPNNQEVSEEDFGNAIGTEHVVSSNGGQQTTAANTQSAGQPVTMHSGDQVTLSGNNYAYYGSVQNADGTTVDYYYNTNGEVYYYQNGEMVRARAYYPGGSPSSGYPTWTTGDATIDNLNTKQNISGYTQTASIYLPDGKQVNVSNIAGSVTHENGDAGVTTTGASDSRPPLSNDSVATYSADPLESMSYAQDGAVINGNTVHVASSFDAFQRYAQDGNVITFDGRNYDVQWDPSSAGGNGVNFHADKEYFFVWKQSANDGQGAYFECDQYGNITSDKEYTLAGWSNDCGHWKQ